MAKSFRHINPLEVVRGLNIHIGVLLVVALIATGCAAPAAAPAAAPTAPPAAPAAAPTAAPAAPAAGPSDSGPIKVGVIMPLTGWAAAAGSYVVNGLTIGVEKVNAAGGVNGRQLELVVEDGKADPKESLSVAEKLMTRDNVAVIVGAWLSTATLAIVPAVERGEVPLIVETSGHKDITDPVKKWVYRFAPKFDQEAAGVESCIQKMGFKEAAFIAEDNDWGRGSVDMFGQMLTRNNIKTGLVEYVDASSTDFYPQLTKIKDTPADVIFVPHAAPNIAKMLQQVKELGVTQTVMTTGGSNWSDEILRLAGPEAAEGSYHILFFAGFAPETAPNPEQAKYFVDTWKQKGWTWDGIAEGSRGYDAILTLVEAIKLGGGGTREQIRGGLEKVDIMGLTAHIKFDANHDAQPNIILVELKDGKSQIVSCK